MGKTVTFEAWTRHASTNALTISNNANLTAQSIGIVGSYTGGTSGNIIGSTPYGSAYLSPWTVTVSGTTWYAINYNHRQAWVPASEVSSTRTT